MDSNKKNQNSIVIQPSKNSLFDIITKKQSHAVVSESKESDNLFNQSLNTKSFSKSILITKQSKKPLKWSETDSRTFFKCLEIFGMDFSMIKEVLSHKTQRQILRKFHKEKKRNPESIEDALKLHENNVIEKSQPYQNIFDNVFKHTINSELMAENVLDDSLDKAVNTKLKSMILDLNYPKEPNEENPIESLDYYLHE
jgi:hypothetical protein